MNPARRLPARAIDWGVARQRLARAFAGMEEALHPSPARQEQILAERARRLAQPLDEGRTAGAALIALIFTLGRERYGVETRYVREVLRLPDVTLVPAAPDHLLGVTSSRGDIIPVFDLQRLFGLPSPRLDGRSRAVVCGERRAEFAIPVDDVDDVARMFIDELVVDPTLFSESERDWIQGVTRSAITILKGDMLLSDRRLFMDQ